MSSSFRKVSIDEMGLQKGDRVPYTLFVYLHASDRYHPIIQKDVVLKGADWENLERLDKSNLFVSSSDFQKWDTVRKRTSRQILSELKTPPFEKKVLGEDAQAKLREFYLSLTFNSLTGSGKVIAVQTLEEMSESLNKVLAPETQDLKTNLLQQMRNLHVMNDMAAISSLAYLIALANGFDSQSSLSQLGKVCLLIDAGLGDMEQHHLETYYRARNDLPSHILEKFKKHPLKSAKIAEKLQIGEGFEQMILVHHELYNGKGYYRGIRTSNVSPLARCLCLAVDLFEQMKQEELNGREVRLKQLILNLLPRSGDISDWRHGRETVVSLCRYLGISV